VRAGDGRELRDADELGKYYRVCDFAVLSLAWVAGNFCGNACWLTLTCP